MSLTLAELALNLLGGLQQLPGRKRCLAEDDGIEELLVGVETPGFCLNNRGLAEHLSHSLANQTDGLPILIFF